MQALLLVESPSAAQEGGMGLLGHLADWRSGPGVHRPTTMEHASGVVDMRVGQREYFPLG